LTKESPQNHILRRIQEQIDFDFIYAEAKDSYGDHGNVSIPPPVILKRSEGGGTNTQRLSLLIKRSNPLSPPFRKGGLRGFF
jgi:hypothetical protein